MRKDLIKGYFLKVFTLIFSFAQDFLSKNNESINLLITFSDKIFLCILLS